MAPAQNVGIVAMEAYWPRSFVTQTELEKELKASPGKFVHGLGQERMGFVDDREDVYSMALTVVSRLLKSYDIPFSAIGRLEVATETIMDHSKSVKTVLMDLFKSSGNTDIEGIDSMNACYAATSALFNSVDWCYSPFWDGRFAIVVSADVAEYSRGPAMPTGGAGAVAMLIGPDATLVLDPVRSTHMENVYDFYKPNLSSPFPVVDGQFSNLCYLHSLEVCFSRLLEKSKARYGKEPRLSDFSHVIFHAPYNKLVQKSFAQLEFIEFLGDPDRPQFQDFQKFRSLSVQKMSADRKAMSELLKLTASDYKRMVGPSTLIGKQLGNTYTASLYMGLLSVITVAKESLAGNRILMFSYGSGSTASMFTFTIPSSDKARAQVNKIVSKTDALNRLESRVEKSIHQYLDVTSKRLGHEFGVELIPSSKDHALESGAFQLDRVDKKGKRSYRQLPPINSSL